MSEQLKYISSAEDLEVGTTYVLPYELRRLQSQLVEITDKRGDVAGHIKDAMEQSSETWHDNAPAEALFGELYQLDTRESGLVRASKVVIEVPYPHSGIDFATIGSRVLYGLGHDRYSLDIVGNLPLNRDDEDHSDVERGSVAAPMPRSLLGATADTTVILELEGNRQLEIAILEIDQTAQERAYA